MDTTTPAEGVVETQPAQTTEAVADSHADDQAIVIDDNGTPSLQPVTSTDSVEETAVATEDTPEVTQAQETDTEVVEWAEKKGLKIDPTNPNEVKLAKMQLENDRRFHEAQQTKQIINPPELLPESEDAAYNTLIERQNVSELKSYVRDWFDANPDMKQYKSELTKISAERPYLQDMEDVAAHLYRDPNFTAKIRNEASREALTNLAQKQQQVPPATGASNTGVFQSNTITPQNVYDMVDSHDQVWFEKNHDRISAAMSGKTLE